MDAANPFAPPAAAPPPDGAVPASFVELVRAWEKLRLAFNAILLLPGIGVLAMWVGWTEMDLTAALILTVPFAIGANVAFFLGPLAELYVRAIFRGGQSIGKGRWLIFGAGLAVSAMVFLAAAVPPLLIHKS